MDKGLRQAVVDPPFDGANRGPDFQQLGSYCADLSGVGHYRCGLDGLFEQYKQLIGQAVERREAKAAITTDGNGHVWVAITDGTDYARQNSRIPPIGMAVARPQNRHNNLASIPIMEKQFAIHEVPVKSMKHAHLLSAMSRVVGGIDINNDLLADAWEALDDSREPVTVGRGKELF